MQLPFDLFRSPSPEPIYDQQGKRQNTREVRARRKIEEQRHQLVSDLLVLNQDYKAPADYRYVNEWRDLYLTSFPSRPQQAKFIDKVMIPQEDHPEVNFVGLIIGPRGNTLKTLEKDVSPFRDSFLTSLENFFSRPVRKSSFEGKAPSKMGKWAWLNTVQCLEKMNPYMPTSRGQRRK